MVIETDRLLGRCLRKNARVLVHASRAVSERSAMNHYETPTEESDGIEIESRTERALERAYTVTAVDGTPISDRENPTVVAVHSGNSAREHRVDVRAGKCTCEDHEYRGVECAHLRRARYALGRVPLDTETLAAVEVHERFAEHCPGPVVATSDGGIIEAGDDGEILDEQDPDDNRPDDCDCGDWNTGLDLPCWPCYRDGFEEPAGSDGE